MEKGNLGVNQIIPSELTEQAQTTYPIIRGNIMSEDSPQKIENTNNFPASPVKGQKTINSEPEIKLQTPDHQGKTSGSGSNNPIEDILELSDLPVELRRAALEQKAEELGMDLNSGSKMQREIRSKLPAGGASDARAENGPVGEGRREAPMSTKEKEQVKFMTKLNSLFLKTEVKSLLESDAPDFSQAGKTGSDRSADIDSFVEFMDKSLRSTEETLDYFAELISSKEPIEINSGDETISIKLSDKSRKVLFEWAIEKIISVPDIIPDAHYQLDIYAQSQLTRLLSLAHRNFSEDHEFIHKIGSLIEVRSIYHNLRIVLPQPEAYKKFLTELRTNGMHFVNNDLAGVSQALMLHERLNAGKLSRVKQWFSAEDIASVDKQVAERMWALWNSGQLRQDGRSLTKWEVDRAIRIANIHFNGTQRQAVYEAAGEIPSAGTSRIASTKNEYISRSLYPFKQIAIRFFAGSEGTSHLMKSVFRRKGIQEDEKYGKSKNSGKQSKTKSIFGLKRETVMANQMGAPDLRSHKGWRNPILNFSGIRINTSEGANISLLDYFVSNGANISDSTLSPEFKMNITPGVETVVLGQTLYLSSLVEFGELKDDLKQKVWQKRAILNPASVVAFRPEIIAGREAEWDAIAPHLDVAFSLWVNREYEEKYRPHEAKPAKPAVLDSEGNVIEEAKPAEPARTGFSMSDFEKEMNAFLTDPDYKYQLLYQPYIIDKLNDTQLSFLQSVIDKAYGEANYLSDAITPHSYMLDDTPYVAWSDAGNVRGLGDPNMFRLFNDQATISEKGWGVLSPIMEHPSHITSMEWAVEAVGGLGAVFGRESAQNQIEPFILAAIDFVKAYPKALWIGGIMEGMGKPRSDIEKYTGAKIAYNETDLRQMLEYAAVHGAISNHLDHGKKGSRLEQLLIQEHLTNRYQNKKKAREIFQILLAILPASFIEFFVKESQEGMKSAE